MSHRTDYDGYRDRDGYGYADGYGDGDADGRGLDDFDERDLFGDATRPMNLEPPRLLARTVPRIRPVRRSGLAGFLDKWRSDSPWLNYAVVVGGVLVVLLVVANLFVVSPNRTNGQAQPPNAAGAGGTGAPSASAAATGTGGGTDGTTTDGNTADASTAPSPAPATGGAVATVRVYNAADNTLGPTTKLRTVTGVPGGKVVTNVGHGTPAGDVIFANVIAKPAGRYTIVIYYLLADTVARRLALWVNAKGPTILSFPALGAGATDTVGTLRVTVTLKAGANIVRFSNATMKYGPDLDRIVVSQAQ